MPVWKVHNEIHLKIARKIKNRGGEGGLERKRGCEYEGNILHACMEISQTTHIVQ
jgi:hypothetical protein